MRDPGEHFKHQGWNCLETTFPKVREEFFRKGKEPSSFKVAFPFLNISEKFVWDGFVGFPSSPQFFIVKYFNPQHSQLQPWPQRTQSSTHPSLETKDNLEVRVTFIPVCGNIHHIWNCLFLIPPSILCHQHVRSSTLPKGFPVQQNQAVPSIPIIFLRYQDVDSCVQTAEKIRVKNEEWKGNSNRYQN